MLRGQVVVGIVGPIVTTDVAHYVQALQKIARIGPRTRIAISSRPRGKSWYYDASATDSWCEQLVTQLPAATAETVVDVGLAQVSMITPQHPLHFFVAGDYLIEVGDHVLGDGKGFLDRLTTLAHMGIGDTEYPDWLTSHSERFPLWKAARTTFLANPQARRDLFAARRADRRWQNDDPDTKSEMVSWTAQRASVHVVVPASQLREIRQCVRQSDQGATVSSALLVVVRAALVRAGIRLQHEQTMIYDARQYLPSGSGEVRGNFVTGLPVRVDDPEDPAQLGVAIKAQITSARPLAALLVGVGRYTIARTQTREGSKRRKAPTAHMVFNNLGVARALQRLPWTADPEHRTAAVMVPTGGPEHITVTVVVVASVLQITASFHSNVFDPEVVRRALGYIAHGSITEMLGRQS